MDTYLFRRDNQRKTLIYQFIFKILIEDIFVDIKKSSGLDIQNKEFFPNM